jgi:hypothetical protein
MRRASAKVDDVKTWKTIGSRFQNDSANEVSNRHVEAYALAVKDTDTTLDLLLPIERHENRR